MHAPISQTTRQRSWTLVPVRQSRLAHRGKSLEHDVGQGRGPLPGHVATIRVESALEQPKDDVPARRSGGWCAMFWTSRHVVISRPAGRDQVAKLIALGPKSHPMPPQNALGMPCR